MTEAAGRRRNTLLACLVLLRRLAPDITVSEMLAFLYVAENPGVRVKELSALMVTSGATASRASRSLLSPGDAGVLPPARGWLLMASNRRESISRHLFLTEAGVDLATRLDGLIGFARPIGADPPGAVTPIRSSAAGS